MTGGLEEIIAEFVAEAEESLEKIDPLFVQLEVKGYDRELLDEIFRSMHTLKGAAGFLGFRQIVDVAHRAEGVMKSLRDKEMPVTAEAMNAVLKSVDMLKALLGHVRLKDGGTEDIAPLLNELDSALGPGGEPLQNAEGGLPQTDAPHPPPDAAAKRTPGESKAVETLRINVDRVDKAMNLAGEIVLVRNRLLNIANYLEERYQNDDQVEGLRQTVSFLDLVTSDMQLAVMKMRMQPLKKVFVKFSRLVRDISRALGKDVELTITGEDTEVDRSVIERIGDPLVHLLRNAIDHGIERTEERLRLNKRAKGSIGVAAYQMGSQIIIEVSDDGKGLDIDRIKNRAVAKSLISVEEAMGMSDESTANLIFLPGFSTVDRATELSGRGVGMDVVKTNISRLNGYVEVVTGRGTGTTFRISIPLTLAIIRALLVRSEGVRYAIPLGAVEETIKVTEAEITSVAGRKMLRVRDRVIPFIELSGMLGYGGKKPSKWRYVVVFAIGDRRFSIGVDELLGQEEVVIKSIEGIDTESTGTLGATITGDGKVVLILDPSGMTRAVFNLSKA